MMNRVLATFLVFSALASTVFAQDSDNKKSDKPIEKQKELTPEEREAYEKTGTAIAGMSVACFAFTVIVSLIVMFIPGMIASARGHRNQLAIWVLCFFLGWTFIGWVVALVWSFAVNGGNQTTVIVERDRPRRRRRDDDDEEEDRPSRR